MKTLILMRHAKSSWAEPGRGDHSRPLNGRGRRGAQALGQWLTEQGYLPDQVLCSDAARTQETWQRLELAGTAELDPTLYHAESGALQAALSKADGSCVLMIAHNPGIADFVCRLTPDRPGHLRFDQYPTGATSVLEFDIADWSELAWNSGRLKAFTIPADLGVARK